jgi:hypothetical protein
MCTILTKIGPYFSILARMDEYELCISDLQTPLGGGLTFVIFIIAVVCTTTGVVGAVRSWAPSELYLTLFSIGLAASFLTLATFLYLLISWCCCRKPKPVRRRSNPLRGLDSV